jgi:hypothetical protein
VGDLLSDVRQRLVGVNAIAVAPTDLLRFQIACDAEIGHDFADGALRNPQSLSNVNAKAIRVTSNIGEHQPMVG